MGELLLVQLALGVRLEVAYAALGVRLELGELLIFYASNEKVSTMCHFTIGTLLRNLYSYAELYLPTHFRGDSQWQQVTSALRGSRPSSVASRRSEEAWSVQAVHAAAGPVVHAVAGQGDLRVPPRRTGDAAR
jgi:hypothetical protein